MTPGRDKRFAILAAAAALALLAVYVLVAAKQRWFQLPSFDYMGQSRIVRGGFPPSQASSMLWKIALLLPATALLAWGLSVLGFRLRLPSPVKNKRFPLILAALAVVLIGGFVVFVLRGAELTDDENTYDFQAKTLLAGRLSNPPPPDLKSFDNKFIINDGSKYAGMYPFGFPMLLAIGKLLGTEYAMTLFLAGALMVLVASIARAAFPDRRVAILAPLLLFVSPFYYSVGASRLSHMATAVLLGSFALLYLRLFQSDAPGRRPVPGMAFLAGILAGLAANIRPLTAAAFLLPFLPALVVQAFSRPRKRTAFVLLMGAGFLAMSALTLMYFKAITGDFFKSPITYYRSSYTLGPNFLFVSLGLPLANLANNIVRMNAFLFGFPVSLMLLAGLALCSKTTTADRAALGILGSFAALYMLWGFPGVGDLGPVYYFECIIPLVLLSSRGFLCLHDFMKSRFPRLGRFPSNFLLLSVVIGCLTFVPERITHLGRLAEAVESPYAAVRARQIHNAVVFISKWPDQGWVLGRRNNSPHLDDDVLFCRLSGPESRARVAAHFPGRDYYVLAAYGSPPRYDIRKASKDELVNIDWESVLKHHVP